MINKVTLIGNLGRDPEVRRLESGVAVARINLATNESYRDKNGEWQTLTEWHTVICWRYLAERAEQQLKKGSMIYVEGKLQTRKWQDQDGNDRYSTEVVANTFRSLDRRNDSRGPGFPSAEDAPMARNQNSKQQPSNENQPKDEPVSEPEGADDLPF